MLREFIFGNNQTGLVSTTPTTTAVIGGEVKSLAGILSGANEIYYGNGATQSTYLFPSATRAAWETFIQGVHAEPTVATTTPTAN